MLGASQINDVLNSINSVLFSDIVVYALLAVGLLFTVWSFFGQYRALTHGVAVIRGKYDDKADPGAINHFQALSAALSATVGLGNIAGVALAVALGGPGAVLWMWLIGLLGMALKMTEVTQSMIFRNTDDPENPHGGPMFVVRKGLEQHRELKWPAAILFAATSTGLGYIAMGVFESWIALAVGLAFGCIFLALATGKGSTLGGFIGCVFVVTLITSAITGGNMFQAWNVADITMTYFEIPQVVTGIILTILVGLVIIGGIKRIGAVAGRVVPFMCVIYILAALYVLALNLEEVPAMLRLIVVSGLPPWLGGENPEATGAFLGGTFGYAAMWGVKRALFSSEAGQGSSPIAHSAAKTDEPVREGVVAGLEPFIDTIIVCTLTALVILSSGAYNRGPETAFQDSSAVQIVFASEQAGTLAVPPAASINGGALTLDDVAPPDRQLRQAEIEARDEAQQAGETWQAPQWGPGDRVFLYVTLDSGERLPISGTIRQQEGALSIEFAERETLLDSSPLTSSAATIASVEPTLYHGAIPNWTLSTPALPPLTAENREIRRTVEGRSGWRNGETVFMVISADPDSNTGRDFRRISGTVRQTDPSDPEAPDARVLWTANWKTIDSALPPRLRQITNENGENVRDLGIFADYAGASLTAYAFDRVTPGLGMWLVSIAAWLFAVSTMISWSYYGEQGVYFLCSRLRSSTTNAVILIYKLIYCALIILTTVASMRLITTENGDRIALIGTDEQLDIWTTLGLGVMLVANIPIMLIFGMKAMKSYHEYIGRLKSGELDQTAHQPPKIIDVVEGKDVE